MSSETNGAYYRVPAEERLNVFALVIYVPDPLGSFLDDLRRELVPHYNPHAHVSVLPPRPLGVDWRVASEQISSLVRTWCPFEVELSEIGVFPVTNVVYLQIGEGAGELRRLHAAMNTGALAFDEPFEYHPHVTLAQEVPAAEVPAIREKAIRRWTEYRGDRHFRAERAVFVQNTLPNCWIDLADCSLDAVAIR
jgi:2'-5' RNA ligase